MTSESATITTTRHAKDETCSQCGAPAVCWWPVCDPDMPSHPYCRPCVEKAKDRVLMAMDGAW